MTAAQLLARVNAQIEATTPAGRTPILLTAEQLQEMWDRRRSALTKARAAHRLAPVEPDPVVIPDDAPVARLVAEPLPWPEPAPVVDAAPTPEPVPPPSWWARLKAWWARVRERLSR